MPLFRLGLVLGTISLVCYLAVTARFYDLFKPVNRNLSLLAAFFSLLGCAIQGFGSIFYLAPLVARQNTQDLNAFNEEQLGALTQIFLELKAQAQSIALVFFGCYCLLIGYLIFRSSFLPRMLGVLMAVAGLGWLTFLSPHLSKDLSPYNLVLGFVAEVLLMLWLLVFGVKVRRF